MADLIVHRPKTILVCIFLLTVFFASYYIPQGYRVRLSVACADFPRIWPTRTNPEIRIFFSQDQASSVRIPVVPVAATALPDPAIARPDLSINRAPWRVDGVPQWKIEQDVATGTMSMMTGSEQKIALPSGGSFHMKRTATVSVADDRPDGAKLDGETTISLELPGAGSIRVETHSWSSRTKMLLTGKVTVEGRVFFEKQWRR